MNRSLAIGALGLIVTVAGFGYHAWAGQRSGQLPYLTATVTRGPLVAMVTASGSLEAYQTADLAAPAAGTLIKLAVKPNQSVTAGQVLAQVDDGGQLQLQLAAAQAQLAQDQAALSQAAPSDPAQALAQAKIQEQLDEQTLAQLQQQRAATAVASTLPGSLLQVLVKPGDVVSKGAVLAVIGSDPEAVTLANGQSLVNWQHESQVLSPLDGVVKAVTTAPGRIVLAGQTLVTLTSPQLDLQIAQAEQAVQSAKASIATLEQGGSPSSGAALAQLKVASDQRAVESLQRAIAGLTLKAPFAGVVTAVAAQQGDVVKAGQTLVSLADESKLTLHMSVDELDIDKVKVGQSVAIAINALPGKTYTGTVADIARTGTVQNGRGSFDAVVEIARPDGALPGMAAQARIVVGQKSNALYVPVEAIRSEGGHPAVITVQNGVFQTVSVTTGLSNDADVEVTSGLSEGQVVVTSPLGSSTGSGPLNLQGKQVQAGGGSKGQPPAPGGGH